MEPFERLLSFHTPEQWALDQISWHTPSPATPSMDEAPKSLYCNPSDLLLRTSSAPALASHSTPEPDGPGVHRTTSTSIRAARQSKITKGPLNMAPPEGPVISLEDSTAVTGRTARKHKLYLSVSTHYQLIYQI
jgi:hypothetical protein